MQLGLRAGGKTGGFSLLELTFAIAILAIAVGAVFVGLRGAYELMRTSRESSIAAGDMQAAFEELRSLSPQDLPLPGSPYQEGLPVTAFTDLHLSNQLLVAQYPDYLPGGEVPDPLVVVLTMSWLDPKGRARSMRMATAVVQ